MNKKLIAILVPGLFAFLIFGCSNSESPLSSNSVDTNIISSVKAIPADAVLDSANLYIYVSETTVQSVALHNITAGWDENSVTWNSFGGAYSPDTVGVFDFAGTGWYKLDVSSEVKGWFDSSLENLGFYLEYGGEDTAATTITSKDFADDHYPYLNVYYTTHDKRSFEEFGPTDDSYILAAAPDSNSGASEFLMVAGLPDVDSTADALIKFDFEVAIRYISFGDFVFLDINQNGQPDQGEPGIEGVTVGLYDCDGLLLRVTTTDADGHYMLDSLVAGSYKIGFEAPEGYAFTWPANGMTACFTVLPGGSITSIDAGLYLLSADIGDFIWEDANMNGLQDDGENGVPDVWVYLYDCDGNRLDSTMTDADGMYSFEAVTAGEYYLMFTNNAGYIFTLKDAGDDDAIDSDVDRFSGKTPCFEIVGGQDAFGWDAGIFAFEGCTHGKGYWKNHAGFGPQEDEVSMLLPVWLGNADGDKSLEVSDVEMAYYLLSQDEYGEPSNGITKLYAHLLTTRLNMYSFANPEDIAGVIAEVDAYLAQNDWNDWDSLEMEERQMVLQWKGQLESYNEGFTGPGHCDDGYDTDGGGQ